MSQATYNIRTLDLHYVFYGIEYIAIITLILILASTLIKRPGLIANKYRTLCWVLTGLLVISLAGLYATDLYNYLHTSRPGYVEINQQIKHSTTGL